MQLLPLFLPSSFTCLHWVIPYASFRTTFRIAVGGRSGFWTLGGTQTPYAKTWVNSTLTPRITRFWESVTELSVKCKRVNRGLSKMAVHTISILFPSYSSDFIHLSLNFLSYKLSKNLSDNHNVIGFQYWKYCGKKPKKYNSF